MSHQQHTEPGIPDFLKKGGIVELTDNVPAGAGVMPPRGWFKRLLLDDLKAAWKARKSASLAGDKQGGT